jgi:hypothetical protein
MVVREEFRADMAVMRLWVKPTLVRHDELTMMVAKWIVKQVGLAIDDGFGRTIKILVDGSGL